MNFETWTRDLSPPDRELMAQHENLGVLRPAAATTQHQQVDHETDETVEAGHPLILIDPMLADQLRARNPRSRSRRVPGTHRRLRQASKRPGRTHRRLK